MLANERLRSAWSDMRREGDAYRGPALRFEPGLWREPTLPLGGVTVEQALGIYLRLSPAGLPRLLLRDFVDEPSPLWQRSAPLPPLSWDRPRLEAYEAKLREPRPIEWLREWYLALRWAWWRRLALHKLVTAAAARQVIAVDQEGRRVPASFWRGNLALDPVTGDLLSETRAVICPEIRLHRADALPANAHGWRLDVAPRDLPAGRDYWRHRQRPERVVEAAIATDYGENGS